MRRFTKPFNVETRGGGRHPPAPMPATEQPIGDWPSVVVRPHPEPALLKSAGRVLPALPETAMAIGSNPASEPEQAATEAQGAADDPRFEGEKQPNGPAPMAAKAPSGETLPAADHDEDTGETAVQRLVRKRLARHQFKRGERWKARLPAAVHRTRKRRS